MSVNLSHVGLGGGFFGVAATYLQPIITDHFHLDPAIAGDWTGLILLAGGAVAGAAVGFVRWKWPNAFQAALAGAEEAETALKPDAIPAPTSPAAPAVNPSAQ